MKVNKWFKTLLLFVFVDLIVLLAVGFIVSNKLADKSATKNTRLDDIEKVYVINLDRSKDRKDRYEKLLRENFGDKFLGQKIETIRFRGTDGKKDIIFEDWDTKQRISSVDIASGKKKLKEKGFYKVYDRHNPSIWINIATNEHFKEIHDQQMGLGYMGCTLSHIRAINDAYKNRYANALIFEDDFDFAVNPKNFYNDLQQALSQTPLFFYYLKLDQLYYNKIKVGFFQKIKSSLKYGRLKYWTFVDSYSKFLPFMTSYIVSYDGAKAISNFVKDYTFRRGVANDSLIPQHIVKYFGIKNAYVLNKSLISQEVIKVKSEIGSIENDPDRHKKTLNK